MGRYKKQNGAVSVFLVIILVPCLLLASIFVDAGRLSLSKGMAQGSAELALNTLMTNYDYDLNDFYGMVVSCQTIEEFYDVSAAYFFRAMQSQNLTDDEKVLISQQFADVVGDDSIFDYLKVEEVNPASISAVDNANLENATMIKNQVVDFMKYRGAIVVAEEIIDRLKSDATLNDFMEADENEPLVESKQEFFEAEAELTKSAYHTYDYLYKNYTQEGYTNEWLVGVVNSLEADRALYQEIHQLMISQLYNTSGLTEFYRPTLGLDYKTYSYTDSGCHSRKETIDDEIDEAATAAANEGLSEDDPEYSIVYKPSYDVYYIDGDLMETNFTNVSNAITAFDNAKQELVNAASEIAYNEDTNDIQYWKRVTDAIRGAGGGKDHVTNYLDKAKAMIDSYAKMVAMMGCEKGDNLPSGYEATYNSYKSQVEERQSFYLTAGVASATDAYIVLMERIEYISSENIDKIDPQKIILPQNSETIDDALDRMAGELVTFRERLQKGVDALDVVIEGDGKWIGHKVDSLDDLLALANKYQTEFGEWNVLAHSVGTNLATADREEIEGLSKEFADKINSDSVTELKTRLTNMRNQLQAVIDVIDGMTYGGEKLSEIKDFNTLKSKASSAVSEDSIPLSNAEIANYADSTFAQLFLPSVSGALYTISTNSDAHMTLDPGRGTAETASVAVPELYVYLRSKFINTDDDKVEETEKEKDKAKKDAEDKEDSVKDKDRYKYSGTTNITKDFSNGNTFSLAGDAVSSFGNIVESLYNGELENIRDNLYLSVYAMEMFSYATYDYEGQYKILEKKTDRGYEMMELNESDYPEKYKAIEDIFNEESPTNAANKSLTNKVISVDNNAAMGAEVEYILYGKDTNAANVKAAYTDIYAIRYGLNLVSAFANFWSRGNSTAKALDSAALFISSATSGVIPVPAVKVVILPILALFETSNDMERLEAGFPVELYKKDANYWHYSLGGEEVSIGNLMNQITNLTTGFQNKTKDNKPISGLHYSDYLTLFVVIGFGSDKSEDMTLRMAEVIQANMRKLTNDSGYDMGKARAYFKIESKIRLKPLLIDISLFNRYNSGYDSSNTDWCTYDVSMTRGY